MIVTQQIRHDILRVKMENGLNKDDTSDDNYDDEDNDKHISCCKSRGWVAIVAFTVLKLHNLQKASIHGPVGCHDCCCESIVPTYQGCIACGDTGVLGPDLWSG